MQSSPNSPQPKTEAKAPFRAVVDTSIIIGDYKGCEASRKLIERLSKQKVLVCSGYIVMEARRTLLKKYGEDKGKVFDFMEAFHRKVNRFVEHVRVEDESCRDRRDLAVLGTVKAIGADVLYTHDEDMLSLKTFWGALIVSPIVKKAMKTNSSQTPEHA